MSKEAMTLALEAVKELHSTGDTQLFDMVYAKPVIKALEEALAKQEQGEPVIDKSAAIRIATALGWQPAQKPWAGLTELERAEITKLKWWDWEDSFDADGFTRAVEAKLKEKNSA